MLSVGISAVWVGLERSWPAWVPQAAATSLASPVGSSSEPIAAINRLLAKEWKLMEAPIFIGELELTEPISGITLPLRADGLAYTGARLLVRMRHIPVGYAFLP